MSFGFSIGNFLAVLGLARKVRKDWVDAPVEYATIRDEARNLEQVLRDIDDYDDQVDLDEKQRQDLQHACFTCKKVLEELRQMVEGYRGLDRDMPLESSILASTKGLEAGRH